MRQFVTGLTLVCVALAAPSARAQNVPRTLNLEGVLRNVAGEAVTGTPAIRFHLYPSATCLGTEQIVDAGALPVIGGVFSQNVDLSALGTNWFADKTAAGLKIEVDGVVLGDCRPLASAAFAFKADTAATASNALLLGGHDAAYFENLSGSAGPVGDERLSANVMLLNNSQTVTGVKDFAPATGNIPFTVNPARNGIVVNLNADRLDNQDGAYYLNAGNLGGTLPDGVLSTNVALLNNAQTFTGTKTFSPSGSAPFVVDTGKTGVVANLNGDLLDGQHGSYYQNAGNLNAGTVGDARLSTNVMLLNTDQAVASVKTFNPGSGTVPFAVDATKTGVVTNLNADLLDNLDSTYFMAASSAGNFIANNPASQQAGANFNIAGNGVLGGSVTAGTNRNLSVGDAYLSSGGTQYARLGARAWHNGTAWQGTGGGILELNPSGLSFQWYSGSGNPAQVASVSSGGTLTIAGNPSPAISTAYLNISAGNTSSTDRPYIRGAADSLYLSSGGTAGNGTLFLNYPEGSGTRATRIQESIFVTNGKYVGVGTAAPGAPLHVVGTEMTLSNPGDAQPALLYIGGKNDQFDNQYINFRNPSVGDNTSGGGMQWWSADIVFGRNKQVAQWGFRGTHGAPYAMGITKIMYAYIDPGVPSGGYSALNHVEIGGNTTVEGTLTVNSYVQVNGVVTENTACASNGLVARNAAGKLLSCESLTWRIAGDTPGQYAFFNASTCPPGWVAANGANGTVDLRGEFVRGWDNGRGVDSGRGIGSAQVATGVRSVVLDGVYVSFSNPDTATYVGNQNRYNARNGTHPDYEYTVRPRNVALLACMKQ